MRYFAAILFLAVLTAAVTRLYDNLDFQRAVQAYLLAIPAVSQAANRNEILKLGPANRTVPIFENRMDSKSIFLQPDGSLVRQDLAAR
jgi:hypothetical protein